MKSTGLGLGIIAILIAGFYFLMRGGATTDSAQGGKAYRVALITPGPINDGGWSQNAYKGLERIKSELKAQTANAVARNLMEALETSRTYADGGYNLIIGHAGEWFDPKMMEIASKSPKTQFLISGCERTEQGNVAGVRFVLEDACYVLGFLAGHMTKTGVLGCVGPVKHPVIESTFLAFANGAKAARGDVDVRISWTHSWDDVPRAKEQTLALIAEKADLIFHNANNGGPGVFQAIQDKKDQGILAFGSNDDQTSMAPDVILASAVLDIPAVFLDTAKAVKEGRFDGKTTTLGMPEGYVWVAYNQALADKVPAEVRKKADEIAARIKKGELKVEREVLK